MLAAGIAGLVLAGAASLMIESSHLGFRATHKLEHARTARWLIKRLSTDVRAAQTLVMYPSFTDRSTRLVDGETGNYLVLEQMNGTGTITRTVGYYAIPHGSEWRLYRHDSANGDSAAGVLPLASTTGTHRLVNRSVLLAGAGLFTRLRDEGVIVRGQFGKGEGANLGKPDFVHFAVSTRS